MPYKNLEQRREYNRRWVAARRAKWMTGRVCDHCGHDGSTHQLELDHLDGAPNTGQHRIWSYSWERIEAETAKCRVLCSKCHNFRHKPRSAHGTLNRYDKYGCRCSLCYDAKSRHNRKMRERHKQRLASV